MADAVPPWPALMSLAVHELRSPATVISGYIKMLLRGHGGTLTPIQREALLQTEQSCDRLVDLLAGMSDFARLNSGRTTLAVDSIDVSSLLMETAASVTPQPGLTFRMIAAPPHHPCFVVADRRRLSQALVSVATMIVRADECDAVVVAAERVEHRVVIALSSTPETITPQTLERLRPFDEFAGGLGLALPLARFVIEAAGGGLHALDSDRPSDHRAAIVLPVSPVEPRD